MTSPLVRLFFFCKSRSSESDGDLFRLASASRDFKFSIETRMAESIEGVLAIPLKVFVLKRCSLSLLSLSSFAIPAFKPKRVVIALSSSLMVQSSFVFGEIFLSLRR